MTHDDKLEEFGVEQEIYRTEEPWLPIETKLVGFSVSIGLVALVVLAVLIHLFILGGH
jgi:hypothetical protein